MDPLSAFALMVKALAELATEAMKGQTAAQREKIWSWYIQDTERWRKFWKLDEVSLQKARRRK